MHTSHSHLPSTPPIHSCHSNHNSNSHLPFTPPMHTSHSHLPYTPPIHTFNSHLHSHLPLAPPIHTELTRGGGYALYTGFCKGSQQGGTIKGNISAATRKQVSDTWLSCRSVTALLTTLAQGSPAKPPSRTSSLCLCARVLVISKPSVNTTEPLMNAR